MSFASQQRLGEFRGIEFVEVLDAFADSDETYRHAKAFGNRQDDSSLRAAVELRNCDSGDPDATLKLDCLSQGVLALGCIEYE